MPVALSSHERIRRANAMIEEALRLPEPPSGQAHGRWLVRFKSKLYNARRTIDVGRCVVNGKKHRLGDTPDGGAVLRRIDELWSKRIAPHYRR